MPERFKDYFSRQAAGYAAYRPTYPADLFQYAASLVQEHDLAWDCATGSGQAAVGIAPYFRRVIGTDASASQIAHAAAHPNIDYRVAAAEHSGLGDRSVDLVTVATALHWFDLDAFYREVNRVLKPHGAIAVWGYGDPVMDDPRLHELVDTFNQKTLAMYWPPERLYLANGYRTLPFPFAEIEPHEWILEEMWTLDNLLGYLSTWSGVQRYIDREHQNPLAALLPELAQAWGDERQRHRIRWPIRMRAGYRND